MRHRIVFDGSQYVAEFLLSADECEGIASALGSHDGGSIEMQWAADDIHAKEAEARGDEDA